MAQPSVLVLILSNIFWFSTAMAQAVPDGDFEEGAIGTWVDASDVGASVAVILEGENAYLSMQAPDVSPMSTFARVESGAFVVTHDQLSFDAQPQSQETGFSVVLLGEAGEELAGDVFMGDALVWTPHTLFMEPACGQVVAVELSYTALTSDGVEDEAWVDDMVVAGSVCPEFIDADADGGCLLGWDLDGDGLCVDAMEIDLSGVDCDDSDPALHAELVWYADFDGDGYGDPDFLLFSCEVPAGGVAVGGDCDEWNASVHPGATETPLDGTDQDCDGFELCYGDADEDGSIGDSLILSDALDCVGEGVSMVVEDCDDDDPEEFPGASWFPDGDGDGFGDGDVTATVQCERPEGHVAVVGDCDDADDASFPGAPEAVADGVDQDCSETEVCWQDADGDGFGALTVDSLDMDCDDAGESWVDGDCEDADASVHPDVPWYVDGDGDGFGSMIDPSMPSCLPVEGYVSTSTDCDDTAAEIHPGASEFVGDGQDQNCDGIELCYEDLDEDGYGAAVIASDDLDCTDPGESSVGTDCDDADPTRSPETPWYPDTDLDGYGSMEATPIASCEAPGGHLLAADDCDDTSAFVHPGATEVVADGIDQDCDEGDLCYEDQDGDGFGTGLWMSEDLDCADLHEASASGDCDDTDPLVNPSTPWYADGDGDGFGDMMAEPVLSCEMPTGHVIASTDCDDTSVAIYPGALEQVADGVDQDCDSVDLCYVDADGDGYGRSETVPGVDLTCEGLSESFNAEDCDDDDGLEFPGAQWYVDADGDGFGDPEEITVSCEQPAGTVAVAGDCDDTRASVNPLGEEIPGNGLDDDCVDGDLPGPTTGTTTGTTPGTTTGRTPGTITVPVEPVPEEDPEVVSYQSGGCGGCASTSTNGMWVALLAMAFIRRRREHIEGSFF